MVTYSPDALQRRMQSPYESQTQQANQFSQPSLYETNQQPQFGQISADSYNQRDPNRDAYSPGGDGQGPQINPYAPVGARRNNNPYPEPYPGITVSPTGQVTGAAPVPTLMGVQPVGQETTQPIEGGQQANDKNPSGGQGPTTSRNNDRNEKKDNKPKGAMDPRNDPNMQKQGMGEFMNGFYKGYSDKEKKWLGSDSTLSEMLRNLVASQGDFASQYNTATGNISDTFRRQISDIRREKGSAMTGLDDSMAASGMMRSSGYGTELGDLTADFARQAFDSRMAKTTGLADQLAERQNFMRQLEIAKTQARSDALRRLAAQQMDIGGLLG